jgi:DNA-binding NarL/FixJ family response regulator
VAADGGGNGRTAVVMDPQPLWVAAITPILLETDIAVVATATTARDALDELERHRPDLFVVEPAVGGPALLAEARSLLPDLRIVAIAASADPDQVDQALTAGAVAYVIKTAQPADIRAGIRQAFHSSRRRGGHSRSPQPQPRPRRGR